MKIIIVVIPIINSTNADHQDLVLPYFEIDHQPVDIKENIMMVDDNHLLEMLVNHRIHNDLSEVLENLDISNII